MDRPKRTVVKIKAGGLVTTFTPMERAKPKPAPVPKRARPDLATRPDELVRSCLYGDSCGCSTRKCWAKGWKAVTMAGDCRACVAGTVLVPRADRPGWDYTLAPAD